MIIGKATKDGRRTTSDLVTRNSFVRLSNSSKVPGDTLVAMFTPNSAPRYLRLSLIERGEDKH